MGTAETGIQLPELIQQSQHFYRKYPINFVVDMFGVMPDPQQQELLQAVADGDAVAAKSGHGTGKTTCLSWLVLWFLYCFAESRVVATAPTQRQLTDILWPEIYKWLTGSPLEFMIYWQATRVAVAGREETWFATLRTSNKPENMQGFHAEYLLILVDEASGVPQNTMEAIEGARTTKGSKLVLAGNATQLSGTFYDAFHRLRAFYRTITMNAELSSLVSKEYCERIAQKYGESSDVYRVRVKGEFPSSEPDVFIPLSRVEAAVMREGVAEGGEIAIGCDPARFGNAESVIYWRRGLKVAEPITLQGKDTSWTTGEIVKLVRWLRREYDYSPKIRVMVDDTGVGAGVVDQLVQLEVELEIEVVRVNFGGPGNEECYETATYLLWGIREVIDEIELPNDDDTVAQISTRKYRLRPDGKLKIESKDEMVARGLVSPDRADALGLCFYQDSNSVIMTDDMAAAMRARRGRK